ncbi:MAG: NUDIX hydrolase [Candidatus Thorarchaeota archaeon]|nr:MAG: NUDIX hydrolase [Candidatus Thorarchaeota archaeon]
MASKLNDIKDEEMQSLINRFGEPVKRRYSVDFLDFECQLVKQTRSKGRLHYITCFIRQAKDEFVVIQKHQYADSGIYRAPSGGARVGESLEVAAHREMHEETGLQIDLLRFVLDMHLDVVCTDETIPWRSLVFLAESIGGVMKPIDTYEIFDVTVMSREDLLGDVDKLMIESGWGGFAYRSFLTREFFKRLDELNI